MTRQLLLGLALASGTAAALAPLQPAERPAPGSTEAELWFGSASVEAQLQQAPTLVDDEALNHYVRGVLCAVAGEYCGDLRLYLLRDPEFNAAMLPNGTTVVFTGALLRLHDEAELAFLLGHEFAHYRARHSLQQWQSTKGSSAALGTFGLLTFGAGAGLVGTAAQIAGAAGLSGYSRRHEREADQQGMASASAAGWSAQAGIDLWDRLAREEAATAGYRRNPVFASHPKTQQRQEDLAKALGDAPDEGRTGRDRHQQAIAPFLADWLEDELSRRRLDPALQVIRELHDSLPEARQAVTAWALGEAHRRRRAEGDAAAAVRWFALAVSLPDPPAAAWREHGYARRDAGDPEGARSALAHYLALTPHAADRAFVERDLENLP